MEVKIINKSNNQLPEYATGQSAGMDIRAFVSEPITIKPLERTLVKTGLFMELPVGTEAQVRPRSGLALKSGITVLNTPGTIDADYRGEIGVILVNMSDTDFTVNNGDRIAQLVFSKHEIAEFITVDELGATDRGEGGFGHTGVSASVNDNKQVDFDDIFGLKDMSNTSHSLLRSIVDHLLKFDTDIICNNALSAYLADLADHALYNVSLPNGLRIPDGSYYIAGKINDMKILVDPLLKLDDFRIFDKDDNLLCDLSKHGITSKLFF